MVRAAAMRLSGADLGLAEFATTLAVKGKRFNTWGFLSAVVQDCINAHEHIPRAAHALIDEQRQEAERYLQLEYAEYRREEARRAVELMTEGAREKLRRRAELRLREQARWERMTNAARGAEVRQCMISDTAASLNIPSFEAWRVTREQQMDQLMSEEAHLA